MCLCVCIFVVHEPHTPLLDGAAAAWNLGRPALGQRSTGGSVLVETSHCERDRGEVSEAYAGESGI